MAQDVLITPPRTSSQAPTSSPHDAAGEGEVPGDLAALRAATLAWRAGTLAKSEAKLPPRKRGFTTWSDVEVPDVLTPADTPMMVASRPSPNLCKKPRN